MSHSVCCCLFFADVEIDGNNNRESVNENNGFEIFVLERWYISTSTYCET